MDWAELLALVPEPATVTIEAYTGQGAHGRLYAAATAVTPCAVEGKRRQVTVQTQDAAGRNVVSSTTVRCPPGTVAPPLSRITLADGTVTEVLQCNTWSDHGLGLPSHIELLCQ